MVIFISSLAGGGAERVTSQLANYWSWKGWQITVVTLASVKHDAYDLSQGVNRVALDLTDRSDNVVTGVIRNLRRLLAVRRVLHRIQPDIAIGMMTTANILLAFATLGLNSLRTVGSERTHPPMYPLGLVWELVRRYSYGQLDVVVGQTSETSNWIRLHTNARRIATIPNPSRWPLPEQMPHLGVGKKYYGEKKLLLAVGRLSSEKQFSLLVDAFQVLADRHSDWDLVGLGEGPLRAALETQVKARKLETRVFFPGRAGNVGEWYRCADLFVLSSEFEGFPNALIEAMSYGIPAVSFDCDAGPRDIIRDKIDGLIVRPGDVAGLIEALDLLMSDEPMRQRFAARAVKVRKRFHIARIAGMWETLFKEITNDNARG